MSSDNEGVAGKFMRIIPKLLSFKCLCHQEALALKHTYKEFTSLQNFNRQLFEIIGFFENSPKKLIILQNSQSQLDYDKIYSFIKGKEIRWNSFFHATNRVRELFPAIVEALKHMSDGPFKKEDKKCAADPLYKILDFHFLYRLNWLSDFLAPICNLNKTLQASSYKLGDLWSDIQSSIDFLRSCYINNKKPPLSNSENLTIKRETEEIMKHHLSFSGFHLERFLSECKFINDKEAAYKYSDKQIISLRFERLQGMGLKFLVLDAAKFLLKELESIVSK